MYIVVDICNNSLGRTLNAYNDLELAKELVRQLAEDEIGPLNSEQLASLESSYQVHSDDGERSWSVGILE